MDNHGITDKKKPAVGVSAGQKLIKIGTHNRSKRVPILKSAAIYGVSATEQAAESEWLTPMSYVHYHGCYNHLGSVHLGCHHRIGTFQAVGQHYRAIEQR